MVVADAVAMTHDGTGLYSYVLAGADDNVLYQFFPEVTVGTAVTRFVQFSYPVQPINTAAQMTVGQAVDRLKLFARNAFDATMYPVPILHYALRGILNDFIRVTKCTQIVTQFSLTQGASGFFIPGDFRPDNILRVYIPGLVSEFEVVGHAELTRHLECSSSSCGKPCKIAFATRTVGDVFPSPNSNYTASVLWWTPLVNWTIGNDNDPTILNIPADYLERILETGGPAAVQFNEKDQGYAAPAFALYREYRDSMRGAGGLGAKSIQREAVGFSRETSWRY